MSNRFKIPALIFYVAITLLPVAAGLAYSLLNSFGLAGIIGNGFTLSNWQQVFISDEFLRSFFYSLLITIIIIAVSVSISLLLCNFLKTKIINRPISYGFYIPLTIPFIVAAFVTLHLLSQSGLFARFAFNLGLINDPIQFPDLVNDNFSIGIIVSHVIIATAFFSILFSNIFSNEKVPDLSIAATTLGAAKKYIRKKIVFPLLLRKATPSIILYSIFIFGSYEIPLLLGRQDPQMISVSIAQKFQKYNIADIPVAYCMASIYTVIIILVIYILFKSKKLIHESN